MVRIEQDSCYKAQRQAFRTFADTEIVPIAEQYDSEQVFPDALLKKMAAEGLLGATIPTEFGGRGWDQVIAGLMHEEIGRACSSARSLLTVHLSLVSETVLRWGTYQQKAQWLPLLATGQKIAAFCLTEPEAGSDAKSVAATYEKRDGKIILNGKKRWTTFGQLADVYLVFARNADKISAFLVDRHTAGVEVTPVQGMLGTRASMIAHVTFSNCEIPEDALLGKEGFGFISIVNTALDNGRFSVALGSLGILKSCLQHSMEHASRRRQFGTFLKDHQLIKLKVTDMIAEAKAAGMLCYNAAYLRKEKQTNALIQTSLAKYYAAAAANRAAKEAVQILGALGCSEQSAVQRCFRDAKIMEIIEGSAEMQQVLISDYGFTDLSAIMED
ncbi:acyl-CoA dehydrogenase family protein [Chitinophaga pinensis]|uniref:Acyl-CoA dehydrogenase domain protein n=1 Tax=Chitinophaga pinensis (strain ATCC 43595 / DSM 2588 / LMG 13176 / NBRC 15968 / NCIMB 11800 / UQM 2034) TaxID=485918 RepID=A0A979G541_CHIPD|nr:acyl-CoA dehydrogenase family protein [Chitinophaga pinensis]ACU60880.1 acyl-CoA dehydrogenase domain protein [Chitinophaga pinensis DSM 2588]